MSKTNEFGTKKYFGNWKGIDDVIADLAHVRYFDNAEVEKLNWLERNALFPTDREVVYASYDYGNYSGSAVMLFKKNGKLYEYSGSHCSCNGLEESEFRAGETSWEALAMRNADGELYGYGDRTPEAIDAIKQLVRDNAKKPKKAKK